MELEAQIKHTVFYNPQNGFSVLRVVYDDDNNTVVTGAFPNFNIGEKILFVGDWSYHPRFGKQFKADSFKIIEEVSGNLIEYLSSGMFPGIGKKTAEQIVKKFGENTQKILDETPDEFYKVKIKGFSAKKIPAFLAAWHEARFSRSTLLFLYELNITGSLAKKIWSKFGENTTERIKENPYILCDEKLNVGFMKADEIAMNLGLSKTSPARFGGALLYTLQEAAFKEGHIFLPEEILIEKTLKVLKVSREDNETIEAIFAVLKNLCEGDKIIQKEDAFYFPGLYYAEQEIADHINFRLKANAPSEENYNNELVSFERANRFTFDPSQRQAIEMALSYKLSIITGGPGTGKTSILKGVLHLAKNRGKKIVLAAPTGRAAKRMADLCEEQAKTIHRLLELDPVNNTFVRNAQNQIECDLLIVDEFSMVDTWLAAALLSAIPYHTHIVFVGDADQLPSVGPGNVLNDLINCPKIPTTKLTHIFRQAGENDIASKAALINQGLIPSPLEGPNFHFITYETPEEAKNILRELLLEGIQKKIKVDLSTELQILSPMRKGDLGIFELNNFLQELLNPHKKRVKLMGGSWSEGDRIMQIKNNYDKNVFNGDIGIIYKIRKEESKILAFFDDRLVEYEGDEIEQIMLAYTCTIHKSQGSEYAAVVVILDNSHYFMLQRNLLYTGVTRAKGHVWILSSPGAFNAAVRNNRSTKRFTKLLEKIE